MKLFGSKTSPYVSKVRIVLEEKGLAYDIDEFAGRRNDPSYERMSPAKRIPILEPEPDVFIAESTVINEYLEETFPSRPLMPHDPMHRAEARFWEDFADSYLAPAMHAIVRAQYTFTPGVGMAPRDPKDINEADVAALREKAGEQLDILEKRLAGRDYPAGDGRGAFSLADVALAVFTLRAPKFLGFDPGEGRPNLKAWMDRVRGRESVKAVLQV